MNLSKIIEDFFLNASASQWTSYFIIATLLAFLLAIFQGVKGNHSRFLEHAPNVMTSLGILGTFTGIVIGLLHFNPSEIDSSIALLLEGLKTAFITSLVGMLASIVFKFIDTWKFAPMREAKEAEDASPKDMYQHIEKQTTLLDNLCKSIAGAEESSLAGSLKLLRTDINDLAKRRQKQAEEFSTKLWGQLDNFATMLSKSATEQIIEALKDVITDFNAKITEQFGDNFKALDASVKKLVDWQQQYMQQLSSMSEQYAHGVKAIDATKQAIAEICETTNVIPQTMEKLATILQANENQIEKLKQQLETFMAMRDAAIKAVPEIQQQVEAIGKQFQQGAEEMKTEMVAGANNFKISVAETNNGIKDISSTIQAQLANIGNQFREGTHEMKQEMTKSANEFNSATSEFNQSIENMAFRVVDKSEKIANTLENSSHNTTQTTQKVINQLNEYAEKFNAELQRNISHSINEVMNSIRNNTATTLGGLQSQIKQTVKDSGESVNKTVSLLDAALQKELNRAVGDLGNHLGRICKKIADEYERMQDANKRYKKMHEESY